MEYTSLEDALLELESIAGDWVSERNLSLAIKELAEASEDQEVKRKCQLEIDCMNFSVFEGELRPKISHTNDKGEVGFQYPDLSTFTEQDIDYVKNRINQARNPFLRLRYNLVLWCSNLGKRHGKQAENAIVAIDEILEEWEFINSKRVFWSAPDLLISSCILSLQANVKFADRKLKVRSFILDDTRVKEWQKHRVISYLIDEKKFKEEDYEGIHELCRKEIDRREAEGDVHGANDWIDLLIRIEARFNRVDTASLERQARNFEKMAEERGATDDTKLIPLSFLYDALKKYRRAGAHEDVERVLAEISEVKAELTLSKVEFEFEHDTVRVLDEYVQAKAEKLISYPSADIIAFVCDGSQIFPKRQWAEEMAENEPQSFLDVVNTSAVDINNNMSQVNEEVDKIESKLYKNYSWYVGVYANLFVHRILIKGIQARKLNFQVLMQYLNDRTWLGNTYTENRAGETIQFSWLSLIAPAIHHYFEQIELAILAPERGTNFILATDSLVLKFEGMLRSFAKLQGISTTTVKRGEVKEMLLDELIEHDELQTFFDEDDRILFQHTFLSKGQNLRNNIAHCFFRFQDYDMAKFHLILASVLRLAKYQIEVKSDSN